MFSLVRLIYILIFVLLSHSINGEVSFTSIEDVHSKRISIEKNHHMAPFHIEGPTANHSGPSEEQEEKEDQEGDQDHLYKMIRAKNYRNIKDKIKIIHNQMEDTKKSDIWIPPQQTT